MDKQEGKDSLWKTTQEFCLLYCRLCKDFIILCSVILQRRVYTIHPSVGLWVNAVKVYMLGFSVVLMGS